MKRERTPVTVDEIRATHRARRGEIRARLNQFKDVWQSAGDDRLWEELVYCIFTAGASARMGLRSVEAVRPFLLNGKREQMTVALRQSGAHRFPVERPGYIVVTRSYLRKHCRMALRQKLQSFSDPIERRDWLAREKQIKGLGYKESSHFLRNIGLMGHAILDKHVMRCLADLQVVDGPRPPATRARYLETETTLKAFARDIKIDFDELDLVLWSIKTGEVLK